MNKPSFSGMVRVKDKGREGKIRCLGIDLGTTKSAIAEAVYDPEKGEPVVRCLSVKQRGLDGEARGPLVPSIVALVEGETYVGEGARRMRTRMPGLRLRNRQNLFFECKNDMGVAKTYFRAPAGYRNAGEIAGHVLRFLKEAAASENPDPAARTVVTVPACFLSAQRNDTLKAAGLAGIGVEKGGLLDEPVAAFLDYLFSYGLEGFTVEEKPKNLLVFDFGGGTCDVALFKIWLSGRDEIGISTISVSHYHRLGGGDIDAGIVHEALLPQFCEQNGLKPSDIPAGDKKNSLEPALLNVAEALKILLCNRIAGMTAGGEYHAARKEEIRERIKGTFAVRLDETGREYRLDGPELSAAAFERILAPFIDTEFLYARDTEYRLTQSVFSPVTDALDRCGVSPSGIDACLMAGGSTLIPQVREALGKFLPGAALLAFPDAESTQTAVARGAAWHALCLAAAGRSVIVPVSHEGISIMTDSGPVEIIPAGMRLPYPSSGHGVFTELAVPQQALPDALRLRVELCTSDERKFIYAGLWNITGNVVNRGDPIRLEYRFDENRNLWLRLAVDDGIQRESFAADIENPVTQMHNPDRARVRILGLEEDLRTGAVERFRVKEKAVELSRLYAGLGFRESAVEWLKYALNIEKTPDPDILNRLGILYGEIGNLERQAVAYREAAAAGGWGIPLFNLALAQKSKGSLDEALSSVNEALARGTEAPYKVLKGLLLRQKGMEKEAQETIRQARAEFNQVASLSEWELGWYRTASEMAGKNEEAEKAKERLRKIAQDREEQKKKDEAVEAAKEGVLPMLAHSAVRA